MKVKGIVYKLKEMQGFFQEDEAVQASIQVVIDQIQTKFNKEKMVNNRPQCLYIIETSVGHVKVGISGSPADRLRVLTSSGGYNILNYYVTDPVLRCKSMEQKILREFSAFRVPGEYLDVSFDTVISTFERLYGSSLKNKDFSISYKFTNHLDKPVYASNGFKYKSIGSFAKAFGLSRKSALKALNTGQPIKGIKLRATQRSTPTHPLAAQVKIFEPKVVIRKKLED